MKKFFICMGLFVAAVAYGATTYTTNYNFGKPGNGDTNFGATIRGNWDSVDTNLKAVSDSVTDHLTDTSAAHAASAVSTTVGSNICTSSTTVQTYLDCLDGVFDPSTSGVVLTTGDQSIANSKTFLSPPILSTITSSILSTNGSGVIVGTTYNAIDSLTTKGDIAVHDGTDSTRLAVGSDDQLLVADSGETEGVAWKNPNPRWRKYTYAYSDFSNAANSQSITAFSLSAKEGVDAVLIKHTTAFSGGSVSSYTVEVGTTGDTNRYATAFNVFQAVANTTASSNSVLEVPNYGASADFIVTARSGGDTLSNATAGSVDIYVRTFLLP